MPGAQIGVYEFIAPLGAGGMGEVYRRRDTRQGASGVAAVPFPVAAFRKPVVQRDESPEGRQTGQEQHRLCHLTLHRNTATSSTAIHVAMTPMNNRTVAAGSPMAKPTMMAAATRFAISVNLSAIPVRCRSFNRSIVDVPFTVRAGLGNTRFAPAFAETGPRHSRFDSAPSSRYRQNLQSSCP